MRTPTYWPTSLTTCSVQTHTREAAQVVKRIPGRRIAYAVMGQPLEVFEIPYGILWARLKLPGLLKAVQEVAGGEWSEFADFCLPQTNMGQTPHENIEETEGVLL